jgi:spore germination protein
VGGQAKRPSPSASPAPKQAAGRSPRRPRHTTPDLDPALSAGEGGLHLRRLALIGLGLALALATAGCSWFGGAVRQSPAGTLFGGGMKVLVFEASDTSAPVSSVGPLTVANKSMVSALAPYWFHVQADGSVSGSAQSGIVQWANANHVTLAPLINNANETSAFLTDATARSNAVANIVNLVQKNGFGGINIDFEPLPGSARAGMTAFMHALYAKLRPMRKLVEVSIVPEGSVSAANQSAFNYRAIAASSDAIVLMTYDQHDDGSCPGPVAQLSWVKERLGVALKDGAPANKILLGIADYGYDWTGCGGSSAQTVGLNAIPTLSGSGSAVRDGEGDPHFTYTSGGTQHVVWYEDQTSVVGKIKLAKADRLQGLALWREGYATAAYWNAIKTNR